MTHYEQLGVRPTASRDEIHAAYRALVKQHHPDVGRPETSRIALLNEAWRVLSDPRLRAGYDATLGRGQPGPASSRPGPSRPAPSRPGPAAGAPRASTPSVDSLLDEDPDYRPLPEGVERRLNLVLRAVTLIGGLVLAFLIIVVLLESG